METKKEETAIILANPSQLSVKDEFSDIDYKKEQSVSAPIAAGGFNHFVLNLFFPGVGSMAHGKTRLGLLQLGGVLLGIPLLFFKWYLGVAIFFASYAWSFITGLRFLKERDFPED